MKQFITSLVLTLTFFSYSQSELKFDKRFGQSENKWVVFQPDSTGVYNFGFIYIDEQAGFTFDYSGTFAINSSGKYIPEKIDSKGRMKYRLQPNNVLVAHIPESKLNDLEVTPVPDWLQYYEGDKNSIERLYRWGYLYNGMHECEKALEYLKKAEKINPNHNGLSVELAFSYNCLQRYDEALVVLQKALKYNEQDAYTVKEYIFALVKKGRLEDAKAYFRKSQKTLQDKTYIPESAYNILHQYFLNKEVKKFDEWLKESESVLATSPQFKTMVEKMKNEIKN
ncbi:tetratricopeptide repeat protein [Flavobacterium suncheonense]|uniref:Uncharacterized protein n=1 Tax=Flavobacterium suncheonense GH29-5 = DSM 17707 TaxID=1121899 RepID=A0A0A2M4K5_9FLAO|nr:tetratricopeptide repeat protein [Flavobacterium suncheonense]KGO87179.1 hypothetical protein Q764_13070 [Flavobacterium suncheonense GH29-5 = DSM 17707]